MERTNPPLTRMAESQVLDKVEQECLAGPYEIFDNMSRILGSGMPRRKAFKLVLGSLVGAALAEFGVKSAWSQTTTCLCQGETYDPTTACCTASGVQQKHPLTSVAACPDKVPHPGYVATFNGCGGDGSVFNPIIPGGFGAANFTPCCNNHDICYGTCNDVKGTCDSTFLTCLTASCDAAYSGTGIIVGIKRGSCHSLANTFYEAVSHGGGSFFEAAQDGACDCCSSSTCPESCAGSACGSLPACAPGGDCVCFTSTEGTGACVHGSTPCSEVSTCNTTADCPSGTACLTTSCCGSFGVCGPLCNPIVPASEPVVHPAASKSGSKSGVPTLGGF